MECKKKRKHNGCKSGYIVAPSYGRVMRANKGKVSIFIPYKANHNVFSPIGGKIKKITSEKGTFKKQFFKAKFLKKAKVTVEIDSTIPISFSSYVGFPFRPKRIRIDVKKGVNVRKSKKIGEILLGSLTETIFPKGSCITITPLVSFMEKVEGGKTKIAKWEKCN